MKTYITVFALAALAGTITPVAAKERTPRTWSATRTADPVTGVTRCVVSASDHMGKTRYSRTGFLYPVIENHPEHGLMVGVSSGGRVRLPSGTILWRVDDRQFREIRPEDGPVTGAMDMPTPTLPPGTDPAAAKAMADAMSYTTRLALSFSATSTFATGERAQEMLAELQAGTSLLFRAKDAAANTGLPDAGMYRVGQVTKDGLKPIPLDESLTSSLAECGVH